MRAFKQNLSVSVVSGEFASTALKALSPQSPVGTSANWAIDLQHVGVSWIETSLYSESQYESQHRQNKRPSSHAHRATLRSMISMTQESEAYLQRSLDSTPSVWRHPCVPSDSCTFVKLEQWSVATDRKPGLDPTPTTRATATEVFGPRSLLSNLCGKVLVNALWVHLLIWDCHTRPAQPSFAN